MSDFTNSFWPIFITVISVGGRYRLRLAVMDYQQNITDCP